MYFINQFAGLVLSTGYLAATANARAVAQQETVTTTTKVDDFFNLWPGMGKDDFTTQVVRTETLGEPTVTTQVIPMGIVDWPMQGAPFTIQVIPTETDTTAIFPQTTFPTYAQSSSTSLPAGEVTTQFIAETSTTTPKSLTAGHAAVAQAPDFEKLAADWHPIISARVEAAETIATGPAAVEARTTEENVEIE